MKKVVVMLPVQQRHMDLFRQQVSAYPGAFEFVFLTREDSPETASGEIKDASVIIGHPFPDLLKKAEKLEWLQLSSAGADAYTKPGILPDHVLLTNSAGAYGLAVSEYMTAVTFALVRRLNEYALQQEHHIWKTVGQIHSVEGSVVLVLGTGDIGGSYARKMRALGAYVIGVRRSRKEKPDFLDEQYTMDELDEVLGRADIVAMILPGGEATNGVMDERRLRLMKPGAFLVNAGRGNAIDPDALKAVLRDGHLGGAALDVTAPEPLPAGDDLWDFPNVIVTPHVAGGFLLPETFERVVRIAADNLNRYASGQELTRKVNRETGY